MPENTKIKNKALFIAQIAAMYAALCCLYGTYALYPVYLVCGVCGLLALLWNTFYRASGLTVRKKTVYLIASAMLALSVVVADYQVLYIIGDPNNVYRAYKFLATAFGGISAAWNIFLAADDLLGRGIGCGAEQGGMTAKKLALICFFTIAAIDLVFLFCTNYPGNLSNDSIDQLGQVLSGSYSNHHPFWHTMVIQCFVKLGMSLFGSLNAGVACYSVFQILLVSASFTFCIVTIYQLGVPKVWVILAAAYFALMPYNIEYSFTMWKDIPFGCAMLVLITAMLRVFRNVGGTKRMNWFLLVMGGLGACVWRTNGLYAFALTAVIFAIFYFRKYKTLALTLFSVLIVGFVMVRPFLASIGVGQTDTIESLSIPAQQIARVITEGGTLSDEEYELLSHLIDVSRIPETYAPHISDPIKDLVRATGDQQYLKDHKAEFFKLWVSVGLKYPVKYVQAWVDQTKGYWNAGYSYWIWADGVVDSSLDAARQVNAPLLARAKSIVLYMFYIEHACDIFRSIGLCTWIILGCGAISLANKRGKDAFLTVPLLAIIATLCIATPVFSEFRYAYSLFTCAPFIICATFSGEKGKEYDHG